MKGKRGSLLLSVLVAISVVTMLALSLGVCIRSRSNATQYNARKSAHRSACMNGAMLCIAEKTQDLSDSHFYAAISVPWERREDNWVMRVSAGRWDPAVADQPSLADECGKIPLSLTIPDVFASLLKLTAGLPAGKASLIAGEIAGRDFVSLDQLHSVTGMTDEVYAKVSPYLTPVRTERININSADETVLRALFAAAGEFAAGPSASLFSRIRAFRDSGSRFSSESPDLIARELGGLPPDEQLLLRMCGSYLSVKPLFLSGYAEAISAEDYQAGGVPGFAYFVWDVEKRRFAVWAEE